jgi:metal-responsive CopG/Arc/MetJ family transcriptional regulator
MNAQYTHRKRVDLRLPQTLIDIIDKFCASQNMTRTFYIETLIRNDIKQKSLLMEPSQKIKRTWSSIDDMPTKPEYET